MNQLLKAMYYHFYKPLPTTTLDEEIDDCHKQLIEALDKPERRLVLQIMDLKDHIADDISLDSFICGFHLGYQLMNELNMQKKAYLRERDPASSDTPLLTKREGGQQFEEVE